MLYRLKKLVTIRFILTLFLLASVVYAGYAMYYKINYWGFSLFPKTKTNVWTVEADVSFEADGNPIKISLATPKSSNEYKVLDQDIVAPGYESKIENGRLILEADGKEGIQNVYYRPQR